MNAPYDAIAAWYDAGIESGSPVHALALPALLELAGDARGLRVCDVGCGQGVLTRGLARRGARVIGVDFSLRLLERAAACEQAEPLGVRYLCADAQSLPCLPNAAFDGAACCLALMDLDDLNAALRAVYRIVRPGGWFVFAITHPCFQTPESRWTGQRGGTVRREVRGYFREGFWRSPDPHGLRGQVGAHHRTLSSLLNALAQAGFTLEVVREPQPHDAVSGRVPGYAEVPAVFAARLRRP